MRILGTQSGHHIGEPGEVASARRFGVELSNKLGFDQVRTGELAIIITEAATNIGKHAQSGKIYLRSISTGDQHGVEVLAVDSGPGIHNIAISFVDGNSSTGTAGTGLGAIQRLADFVDIYSEPGKGTALLMILWANPDLVKNNFWEIGNICIPIPSEPVCGDAWIAVDSSTGLSILVADGLGHGSGAADASILAVKTMEENPEASPGKVMQNSHAKMIGSRGAAVAVAKINATAGEIKYCGVGNIAGSVYTGPNRQHLISHNGIVGVNMRKTQEFLNTWNEDSILIMHSDGIGTKWAMDLYPGLEKCHSAIIAAVLHRDFTRERDDATVLVVKRSQGLHVN